MHLYGTFQKTTRTDYKPIWKQNIRPQKAVRLFEDNCLPGYSYTRINEDTVTVPDRRIFPRDAHHFDYMDEDDIQHLYDEHLLWIKMDALNPTFPVACRTKSHIMGRQNPYNMTDIIFELFVDFSSPHFDALSSTDVLVPDSFITINDSFDASVASVHFECSEFEKTKTISPQTAIKALGGITPFSSEPEMQRLYRKFLEYCAGLSNCRPSLLEAEEGEFKQAAVNFRPMSEIYNRFVLAIKKVSGQSVARMTSEAIIAPVSKTREKLWKPSAVLLKRFCLEVLPDYELQKSQQRCIILPNLSFDRPPLEIFGGVFGENKDSMKRYTKNHEWLQGDELNRIYSIGISNYSQRALGDIVYIELPEIGSQVDAAEVMGLVESVKGASDVYAPISGSVIERNDLVLKMPSIINNSPESKGWLIKVKAREPIDTSTLMSGEEYSNFCKR